MIYQPARDDTELTLKILNKLTMRHMMALTAGTGAALALTAISACGASTGHGHYGSVIPQGTSHGTFPYCSYTPDSDGIEISHWEHTPCLVTDVRTRKERKHATPSPTHSTIFVPPTTPRTTPTPTRTLTPPTTTPTTTPRTTPTTTSSAAKSLVKTPKVTTTKKSSKF